MNNIHSILEAFWGYKSFRPLQEDIVTSVLNKRDTLALMPTGGGKSICYQIPALATEGICIVVSPLIALMKDQVNNLQQRGIKATAVFSGMTAREIDIVFDNCAYGDIKLLYLSPERLTTDLAVERIKKMQVNLIAVDEAHCISQWGYDFRPSYLDIAKIRALHPSVPVLALTATATSSVIEDIQEKLQFKEKHVLSKSFKRDNISYSVFYEENKLRRILKIIRTVQGSGIIYVRNRKKTKELATALQKKGISADYYHAGLSSELRTGKQEKWMKGSIKVIVCTNAFGMGIDKPDVRFVIHYDIPENVESYFQEAGRAGRDGNKSFAVLLYENSDILKLQDLVLKQIPEVKEIRQTYQALANYYQLAVGSGENDTFDFDLADFCTNYKLNPLIVHNSLKQLEREDWLVLTESVYLKSRVKILATNEQLYDFQIKNKSMDLLIKTLLRSYEGIFDNYTKIDEFLLAKRTQQKKQDVVQALKYFHKLKLMDYAPAKDLPQIIFKKPRSSQKNLSLNHVFLKERKKIIANNLNAIINYVQSDNICRSQLLLGYFGENDSERCGICDVCLRLKKLNISEKEFNVISTEILNRLKQTSLSIHDLANTIPNHEDKTIKVVRWLMDTGRIHINSENKLFCKQ